MIKIKELRESQGMTQKALASMLRVTQGAVHQWESGITKPRADVLIKLAEIFDCAIDDLF